MNTKYLDTGRLPKQLGRKRRNKTSALTWGVIPSLTCTFSSNLFSLVPVQLKLALEQVLFTLCQHFLLTPSLRYCFHFPLMSSTIWHYPVFGIKSAFCRTHEREACCRLKSYSDGRHENDNSPSLQKQYFYLFLKSAVQIYASKRSKCLRFALLQTWIPSGSLSSISLFLRDRRGVEIDRKENYFIKYVNRPITTLDMSCF